MITFFICVRINSIGDC